MNEHIYNVGKEAVTLAYDARKVANWFVARAAQDGKVLSIMTLLKLTYIAHGWHLETKGKPLFPNRVEAWQYGPVIPDVYSAFRGSGINVTGSSITEPGDEITNEDASLLEQVYNIYGSLSAFQLSDLTHVAGGPWDITMQTGGHRATIPNELIRQHYSMKRRVAEKQRANV